MTVAAVAFSVAAWVISSATFLVYHLQHRPHADAPPAVLEQRLRRQWVITTKTGDTFRGVLVDHDDACLVLASAEHLADPQSPVPVDGEIVVLLGEVKYAQRL